MPIPDPSPQLDQVTEDLSKLVEKKGQATEYLEQYRGLGCYLEKGSFTGSQFEQPSDTEHPNEITERDMVAVTMLSVKVPARCAIWLLGEGRQQVPEQLAEIPPDLDMWNAEDEVFDAAL